MTGDIDQSTDEEQDQDYEDMHVEQENHKGLVESLKNVIGKGKYVKIQIKNIRFDLYAKLRNSIVVIS